MKAHAATVELWHSERLRGGPGDQKHFVRWRCSCGRIGPALPSEGTIGGRLSSQRRASNGGIRHVAAMERSK